MAEEHSLSVALSRFLEATGSGEVRNTLERKLKDAAESGDREFVELFVSEMMGIVEKSAFSSRELHRGVDHWKQEEYAKMFYTLAQRIVRRAQRQSSNSVWRFEDAYVIPTISHLLSMREGERHMKTMLGGNEILGKINFFAFPQDGFRDVLSRASRGASPEAGMLALFSACFPEEALLINEGARKSYEELFYFNCEPIKPTKDRE